MKLLGEDVVKLPWCRKQVVFEVKDRKIFDYKSDVMQSPVLNNKAIPVAV